MEKHKNTIAKLLTLKTIQVKTEAPFWNLSICFI